MNKKTASLIVKIQGCIKIRVHLLTQDKFLRPKPFKSTTQCQILTSHSGVATDTNRLRCYAVLPGKTATDLISKPRNP